VLQIEGDTVELTEGKAAFVPAGADHQFTGYEGLSVLVVFSRPHDAA
jgi:quercetin dioxygenase-like cupin family protein